MDTLSVPAPYYSSESSGSTGTVHITNLLTNGTFEKGNLDGWIADTETIASTAEAHSGDWSARIPDKGLEITIDTSVNVAYKTTAWIKIVSDSGSDWGGFRVEIFDRAYTTLGHSGWLLQSSHGGEWFKVAITFTATTPQTHVRIGYSGGSGRKMLVHVDDIAIFAKQANVPPEITTTLEPTLLTRLPQTQQYRLVGDDPDGAIVRVLWDFGDGTRALTHAGARSIALSGVYTATVRVADDEGAITTRTIPWRATGDSSPELIINAPTEHETIVHADTLMISGSANRVAARVRVSTDRGYAGLTDGISSWSARVPLEPGLNRILVQAEGANGRVSTVERLVRYISCKPLQVSNLTEVASTVERWAPFEATFLLDNSSASHPQFPYDSALPPGLGWVDGVTVDGVFTPDNWRTIYRRPAFLNQPYQRALKDNQEWLYPMGGSIWTVRFAPPTVGTWRYRIDVHEAKGSVQSAERTFTVAPATHADNHGPVRVALRDTRYFEYADGTPFLGTGHQIGFDADRFSYQASEIFDAIGSGNQQFFRWWIGGRVWGSAWQPWHSRTLNYDGYLPATGLTLERAYGDGLAALKLDSTNPIMFQGIDSGHTGLIPGRTYRLRVRWRTENVTGPADLARPYGVTVKFTGWPEPGQTAEIPALIPHVHGDTPWHLAEADFVADGDLRGVSGHSWNFIPNIALILENTTGGAAYVDEIDLYEVLPGGSLGTQLLRNAKFNSHLVFDSRRAAGIDAILVDAAMRGMYFKLVVSEKAEYLLNHLGPDGLPDRNGGNFNGREGSPNRRLHEYYWRYIFARFGAFRSVQSWELVNEEAPAPGDHFRLAAALAIRAAADGNPHPATTSTWSTLAVDAWKDPGSSPIAYVDFHAYARGTGWIEPEDQLANDSARFFAEYDSAAKAVGFDKPVIWGEQGIDTGNTDEQEPDLRKDQEGVWLHKLTWARCGPGGVYPLYWYTDNIFDKSLHKIYGAWNRFMTGIPFANGHYEDIGAISLHPALRTFGQKDLQSGRAYMWIDNQHHTWRAVVDRQPIPPVTAIVRVPMTRPHASYSVTWYNTATGEAATTDTITADSEGILALFVAHLRSDIAVKIALVDQ